MRALKQLRRCTSHGDGAVVGVSVVLTQELDVCHDTRCARPWPNIFQDRVSSSSRMKAWEGIKCTSCFELREEDTWRPVFVRFGKYYLPVACWLKRRSWWNESRALPAR
jgi:hypothetical protein